jgi:uncharacterized membrane protein YraQ (UPF0718 family)
MAKKGRTNMLIPTVIMAVLAVAAFYFGYTKGEGQHITGLKLSLKMTVEILPLLVFAFILAGMVQVLLPQAQINRWIGDASGLRGIVIGTIAGGITPGGPYVSLPLAAGLLKAGAGWGTMVAYVTAWSLWAVARMPMEVGIMGWKFTFVRFACTFFFPPIAGIMAQVFFSGMK